MHLNKEKFEILRMCLQSGRTVTVIIASDSMSPLIKTGERLDVWAQGDYRPFDIIVYHHTDGRLICHYIWQRSKLEPRSYLLRSLKGGAFDLLVSDESILGAVSGKSITGLWKTVIFFKFLRQKIRRGFF